MNPKFKTWLIEKLGLSDSVANSRVANIHTVERHYGDIDVLLQTGGAQNLMSELTYSTDDERNARPQKHKIPIYGNIYTGSATLKQAVKKYITFYNERVNIVDGNDVTEGELSQPMEDLKNGKIDDDSNGAGESIFDILGIGRLESVHTNFLKWWLDCSRKHPVMLQFLVQSIVMVADRQKNDRPHVLRRCSESAITSMMHENNCVRLKDTNAVTAGYPVYCNGPKGEKMGSVDLVVDTFVNGEPLKIILENKIFSKEHDSQTKIYGAYFTNDESELRDGIRIYKKNQRNKKGKNKNQPKKLRAYKVKENQLFVFLHPIDYDCDSLAKDLSRYFIKYTYDDLWKYVIFPCIEDGVFSAEEKVLLAEYLRMLITQDKYGRVMAEESEESKRLLDFKATYETFTFAESQKGIVIDKSQSKTFSQIADDAYKLLGKIDEQDQIEKV